MSLIDKLKEIIASEQKDNNNNEGDDKDKQIAELKKQLEEKNKSKDKKEDPRDKEIADLKAQLEKESKESKEGEQDQSSSDDSKGSAFPPPNSKGTITAEMIKDLPDTPENRELLIQNMDVVSRAMSGK